MNSSYCWVPEIYLPSKVQLSQPEIEDIEDACRVFAALRILQDFVGCEPPFLDLADESVLLNCNSLDFVEELDYLVDDEEYAERSDEDDDGKRSEQTEAVENLPFFEYSVIVKEQDLSSGGDNHVRRPLDVESIILADNLLADEVINSIEMYCIGELSVKLKLQTKIMKEFWQDVIDIADSLGKNQAE